MKVVKRNGSYEEFDLNKIINAVNKAFKSCDQNPPENLKETIQELFKDKHYTSISIENIQNTVENMLMDNKYFNIAKSYILYREQHKQARFIKSRLDYMKQYSDSTDNAATASETDANANITMKNVANLEGEVYKTTNRIIQRQRMKEKLQELFPEVASKYEEDLNNHIIYTHDEASTPVLKNYCEAVSLYPLMLNGVGEIDGITPTPPNNLNSFCGQFVNLAFLLAAQCKGAVAFGGFFVAFNYYCIKEWGEDYHLKSKCIVDTEHCTKKKTIEDKIIQAFQQCVWGINQPAGNRGYQSPFINFSYYDSNYFKALFEEFVYPDFTKPKWEAIDYLQRLFMKYLNNERLKAVIAMPVETMALLSDGKDIIDKEYKAFTAEMYAEGHSFFTYISDNPNSLSSCCFSKDTKILWKNSYDGVKCTTLEELHKLNWEPFKANLRIFHNGSWIKGKSIKLPNKNMYKVTTYNNKEFIMSEDHINVTYEGEKPTSSLTTDDYLMFNTFILNHVPENNEHLTYEQGLLIGLFIGDGTFGNYICQDGSVHNFQLSLNKDKWETVKDKLNTLGTFVLGNVHNNVYPVRCYDKELTTFISRWTTNEPNNTINLNCLLQTVEFRQGILDGWYISDGGNSNRCYTINKQLVEDMEILCTSLGLQTIINISDRTDEDVIIRGIEYTRSYPLYCLRWDTSANHGQNKSPNKEWKKKNNSLYWRIKSIEPIEYSEDIYCIQCDNHEEPYFTLPSGLITHNCRLRSEIEENTFSFTNGLTGIQTGSVNVITLNLNRIIQDWYFRGERYINCTSEGKACDLSCENWEESFTAYLINILERVYKYHIAFKTMLYDLEDKGMLTSSKAGYIYMKKLYSTIGLNGINEAAEFLGLTCSYNKEYKNFCNLITSTIKEQNKIHSIRDKKRPFLFNCEFVPAESLSSKNYNWDKEDGYLVPKDRNLYNSYFYLAHDNTSVLDKIKLHGKEFTESLDGGVGCHINLEEHLSKEQYSKLIEYAVSVGNSYFTFNIPNSECKECGYITKHPITQCPKCNSTKIKWYTRIIGYLRAIENFGKERQIEAGKRVYTKPQDIC